MSTSLLVQHLRAVKGYFKSKECSDKLLRIVEIDEERKPNSSRKRNDVGDVSRDVMPERKKMKKNESNSKCNVCKCHVPIIIDSTVQENGDSDRFPVNGEIGCKPVSSTEDNVLPNVLPREDKNVMLELTECSRTKKNPSLDFPEEERSCSVGSSTMEEGSTSSLSSSSTNEKTYSVFPVHSLVLSINSVYFKSLMMKKNEEEILVKVKRGKGKYLELLVNSFYDPDAVVNLKIVELLQLLQVAHTFSSDSIIVHGLHQLKRTKVTSLRDWDAILEHMQQFQSMGNVPTAETYSTLTHTCVEHLVKTFTGFESSVETRDHLNELSLMCLMLLLISKKPFVYHENSLLHFIVSWLLSDEERQTEDNIKLLLRECNYEEMSAEYLTKVLTPTHPVLSKWRGWTQWHYKAVCYHALANNTNTFPESSLRKGHAFTDSNRIQQCVIKFNSRTITDMSRDMSRDKWVSRHKEIVFDGCILTPEIDITKCDYDKYDVNLHMNVDVCCRDKNADVLYLKCDVAFAVFPAAGCFSRNLFTNYDFVVRHFRRRRLAFHKNNVMTISAGTLDEDLLTKFEADGLFLSLAFKRCDKQWPTFGKTVALTTSWSEKMLDRKLSDYL